MAEAGRRVLVIEDDETTRELLTTALTEEGYAVRAASTVREALQFLAEGPPGLILLDLMLPKLDGEVFARTYRQMPQPHAPIVLLSAATFGATVADQLGAAEFIAKPFELDDLLKVVAEHLPAPSIGAWE